jgi:hypothetical protein
MRSLRPRSVSILSFFVVLAACGGKQPPTASAPSTTAPPASSQAASSQVAPPSAPPGSVGPSEETIRAFLAARPGEEPASSTQMDGLHALSDADEALRQKCSAAKDKAVAKASKKDMGKQMADAFKAMDGVSKRCLDLGLLKQTQGQAEAKDMRAQSEMRVIAKGLAASKESCGAGAQNPKPRMGPCFNLEPVLWDREGWSCVAKGLSKEDRDAFEVGAAYVYSFKVDAAAGGYEVVGRGCSLLLGQKDSGNAETELVLRGKVGEPPAEGAVYRRKPSK